MIVFLISLHFINILITFKINQYQNYTKLNKMLLKQFTDFYSVVDYDEFLKALKFAKNNG
jgi:hypothetical protein